LLFIFVNKKSEKKGKKENTKKYILVENKKIYISKKNISEHQNCQRLDEVDQISNIENFDSVFSNDGCHIGKENSI
jgi:hypothetical protein